VGAGSGIDPNAVAARHANVRDRLERARERAERATRRAGECERDARAERNDARADRLWSEARMHQQAAYFHAIVAQEMEVAVRLLERHLELDLLAQEAGTMLAISRTEIDALLSDEMAHSRRIGDRALQQRLDIAARRNGGGS
jgi:hypothetical protein